MKLYPLAPLALAMAVVTGAGVSAQTTGTTNGVAPPSAREQQAAMTDPRAFGERAASSNQFEIQSSQLALQMAQSAEVRAFAERMIADHQAAGEKFVVAASAEGLTPSNQLMPDHQAQLDALAASTPEDFDAAYVGAQLAAHKEAVMLFQGYSQQGPEGPLKTFAAETLPTLQDHLAKVEPLAST